MRMISTLRRLGLAMLLAICGAAASAQSPDPNRPNIIYVLTDDQGYGDLACFGHPEIRSPHLDRLAAEGVKLTHSYAGAPVCSPARAAVMTGRTPYRAGIYNWIPMMSPVHLREGEVTIARLLKEAGYATAMTGKWHLNGMFNLLGQTQPGDHGFEYWFAVQNNALPSHRNPYNFVRNGIPVGPIEGYSALIVADDAINWLANGRDKSKPFFLYVTFHEPHEPIATDPRYAFQYAAAHPDDPSRVAYYGNVTQMDAAFGRIMAALESQGLAENTLIWFTSDNGPARTRWHNAGSSGGLREYKLHLYEGGIRVPGIVRWPGRVAPGSVSEEPVSGVDVLQTLCEVAGIAPPSDREFDGASIVPVLEGRPLKRSKPLYWQYVMAPSRPQVAIRQGKWKLLAGLDGARPASRSNDHSEEDWKLIKQAGLTDYELYDLEADPAETNDLAGSRPDKVRELAAAMSTIHESVKADAPAWPAWTFPGYEGKRIAWPDYIAKPL